MAGLMRTMSPLASPREALASPALSDLGLGDQVKQQLEDQLAQQKKKNIMAAGTANMGATPPAGTQNSAFSPAVQMLFGDSR